MIDAPAPEVVAILNWLAESAILPAAFLGIAAFGRSAPGCHLRLYRLGILAALILPCMALLGPGQAALIEIASASLPTAGDPPPAGFSPALVGAAPLAASAAASFDPSILIPLAVFAWVVGALIVAFRFAISVARLGEIFRSGSPPSPDPS